MSSVVPLYTSEEYEEMVSRGVLGPGDRVELLEGVIIEVSPQSPRHAAGVGCAEEAVRAAVGGRAAVRSQLPFRAGPFSVPEPDIAVVPGRVSDYRASHPAEAFLIVEVADSSLTSDRMTKARVYAAAGVPEYWIVDLSGDAVEVHTDPDPDARQYRSRSRVGRGGHLRPVAFPDTIVAADDLLGPAD